MSPSHVLRFFVLGVIPLVAVWLLGYRVLREETLRVWILFLIPFLPFIWLKVSQVQLSFRSIIVLALLMRLVLLLAVPSLSDDYLRFVWDGRLIALGFSPYAYTPADFMAAYPALVAHFSPLYEGLNSPHYYSVYPPVAQGVFYLGAALFPDSLLGHLAVMRLCVIAAEMLSIFWLARLLHAFKMPAQNLVWYALNPIVALELTGNLHLEAFFVLGIVGALYGLFVWQNTYFSALLFALGAGAKLLPLMLLPLLWPFLRTQRLFTYAATVVVALVLTFLPFWGEETLRGLSVSLQLYFQSFEFNASLYYLVRWVGYQLYGYNIIGTAGKYLPLIPLAVVAALSVRPQKSLVLGHGAFSFLTKHMLWVLTVYFFAATIVHPWYIVPLVAVSVLTPYRFPVVWLGLALLSYATYQTPLYLENMWLVGLEYVVVYAWAAYELWQEYTAQRLQGIK